MSIVHSRSSKRPLLRYAVAIAFAASFVTRALAMPECRPAGPISAGLRKLIREFADAKPGQPSTASVEDFLVGVSGIPSLSQSALVNRGPVRILPSGSGSGDLASDGPQPLQFEGVFAHRRTLFKVPQRIRAGYRTANGALTIAYKEGAAIALGEAVPLVDIPVYRRINHVIVSPDRLLFFWDSNSGPEPDRCYVVSAT